MVKAKNKKKPIEGDEAQETKRKRGGQGECFRINKVADGTAVGTQEERKKKRSKRERKEGETIQMGGMTEEKRAGRRRRASRAKHKTGRGREEGHRKNNLKIKEEREAPNK